MGEGEGERMGEWEEEEKGESSPEPLLSSPGELLVLQLGPVHPWK
jgi:hypothetical protein